jgi:hypothetical protein
LPVAALSIGLVFSGAAALVGGSRRRVAFFLVAVSALTLIAACGGDDSSEEETGAPAAEDCPSPSPVDGSPGGGASSDCPLVEAALTDELLGPDYEVVENGASCKFFVDDGGTPDLTISAALSDNDIQGRIDFIRQSNPSAEITELSDVGDEAFYYFVPADTHAHNIEAIGGDTYASVFYTSDSETVDLDALKDIARALLGE